MVFRCCLALGLALLSGCGDGNNNSGSAENPPVETIPTPADAGVQGPITGPGEPFVAGTRGLDLADAGYEQAEFFLSGTANSYVNVNEFGADGVWQVSAAAVADYTTRLLVYRPTLAAEFSGTVIVEWLNVSGGLDAAPDWSMAHTELIREGHVWVGVSAQVAGVEGGGSFDLSLKTVNPARYEVLQHPGDSFSYDMFSQAAQALRAPVGVAPLGGLEVENLIAIGESQSAGRLLTYVNAFAPLYQVFDGYLIHSRTAGSSPLSQAPQVAVASPQAVRVREDLDDPVLMFQTETDLLVLGSLPSRQDDSSLFRLWEVAGTAHNDVYSLLTSNSDLGDDPSVADVVEISEPVPGFISCDSPINAGPQHWVLKAGLHGLLQWVEEGRALPIAPRLEVSDTGQTFVLDVHGNVRGGIRTPYVDVPVATLSGLGQSGESFCRIFGTTALFDAATLAVLYATHSDYVGAVIVAADTAVAAGFILAADADLIKTAAENSAIGI